MHKDVKIAGMLLLCLVGSARAAIVVDGRADEPEWANAHRLVDFVSVAPFDQSPAPPGFATEARVLATPEGLAALLIAKHPASVPRIAPRVQRDFRDQVDRANFMVDFDADGRSAYDFTITTGNDIADEVITREVAFANDWDASWQHAVAATPEGYSFEWLIPWSITSMKPGQDGKRKIAVYFDRVVAHTGQRFATPAATFTRPRFVSDFTHLEVASFEQRLFAVTPYGVALSDLKNSDQEFKFGADLFWKPNSNHQFALTLNPDFGQIESDDLVVNFDAIETFFTDKRPFFTDNQSAFDGSTPGGNLFYTRRVGGPADDGSGAADINAAIKANGNFGDFGYAFFGASEDGEAGRDFALARLAHRNDAHTIDLTQIQVDRPFLNRTAQVSAVHGIFRPNAEWTLDTALHRSSIDVAGERTSGIGGGIIADWDMPGPFRQQYFLIYVDRDENLNDLGFQDRNNLRNLEWETGYRQDQLDPDSMFASHAWELELLQQENLDHDPVRETITLQRYSEFRNGGNLFFFARYRDSVYDDLSSRGNGIFEVEGGPHVFAEANLPRRDGEITSWYLAAEAFSTRVDGYGYFLAVQPRFQFTETLDWSIGAYGFWQDDWLIWQGGREFGSFKSERLDLVSNLNWFINDQQELRIKLQSIGIDANAIQARRIADDQRLVDSDAGLEDFRLSQLGFQIRYRYKLGNLSDIFVVYSRGGMALDEREHNAVSALGEAFELRDDDQFLIKLAYRFEL